MHPHVPRLLTLIMALAVFAPPLAAQFHDFDPAATKAFEEMVEAHRKMPALTVKTRINVELLEGDLTGRTEDLEAEFFLSRGKGAVVKLRGFTIHLADGEMHAIHDGNETSYFAMPDGGSPYYALMASFMDLPYPHLAIFLGEEDIEELCMQFHSRAPWIRPTAVREEPIGPRAGVGEDEEPNDPDRTVQIITLSSDFEEMELVVDPKTKVIESLDLKITGGGMVQEGTTLVYKQRFENTIHDEPPGDDAFVLDPGDRERAMELRHLIPRRAVAAGGGGRRGVAPAGGLVGRPAPEFTLATLDGGAIDLEDLRGRVVVLDFWATWCGPCLQGLRLLHQLHDWMGDETLPAQVITINTLEEFDPQKNTPDRRREQAREFWQRHGFTLPVAMDYTDEVAAAYGVQGIPTTIVIRSDGVVHTVHIGVVPLETLKTDVLDAISALEY